MQTAVRGSTVPENLHACQLRQTSDLHNSPHWTIHAAISTIATISSLRSPPRQPSCIKQARMAYSIRDNKLARGIRILSQREQVLGVKRLAVLIRVDNERWGQKCFEKPGSRKAGTPPRRLLQRIPSTARKAIPGVRLYQSAQVEACPKLHTANAPKPPTKFKRDTFSYRMTGRKLP